MSSDFLVNPDELALDARVWRGWADELKSELHTIPTDVEPLAFSVQPGFPDLATEFLAYASNLNQLMQSGITQFEGFANRVIDVSELYREVEQTNQSIISGLGI